MGEFLVWEVSDKDGLLLWSFNRDTGKDFPELAKLRFLEGGHAILIEKLGRSVPEKILLSGLIEKRDSDKKFIKALHRDALMSRSNITVYADNGFKLFGVPVSGEEWKRLPDKTKAILVRAYNPQTGLAIDPLEAFEVKKDSGGRCSKDKVISAKLYTVRPVAEPKPEDAWRKKLRAMANIEGLNVSVSYFPEGKGHFKDIVAMLSDQDLFVAIGKANDMGAILIFKRENGELTEMRPFVMFVLE